MLCKKEILSTYVAVLVLNYNIWKGLQCNQVDKYKTVDDSLLDSKRFEHKYQDKDPRIYY